MTPSAIGRANLAVFAVAYVGACAAVWVLLFAADVFAGYRDPPVGIWIGPFAGATIIAGQRAAKRSDWKWTREDRHKLAMAYVVVAFLISLLMAAPAIYFLPDVQAAMASIVFWGITIGSLLLLAFAQYVLARVMFAKVVRPSREKVIT